jgi:hypothetical protein
MQLLQMHVEESYNALSDSLLRISNIRMAYAVSNK